MNPIVGAIVSLNASVVAHANETCTSSAFFATHTMAIINLFWKIN